MPLFPPITGLDVRAQYPNEIGFEFLTNVTNLSPGPRVAYAWRMNAPARYALKLRGLTDSEVATLETFFKSQQGRFGQFCYIDPTGNMLQFSEDFSQTWWVKACTVGAAAADPLGGTAATILAGDSSGDSSVSQVVALDPLGSGHAAGSKVTFSVYLKAVTAAGVFNIWLSDGIATTNQACVLSTTAWARVVLTVTLGASPAIRAGIGGNSTWTGTNQVAVFGPMLSLTPAPPPYLKTPGIAAVRALCRFDQDALDIDYKGPNQHNLDLKISEIQPQRFITKLLNAHFPIGSLGGAWTDGSGNVIQVVWIGNGPANLVCPAGATQLQLGINDVMYFYDIGSWTITVNGVPYTLNFAGGWAEGPWSGVGGMNAAYSFSGDRYTIQAPTPLVIPGFLPGMTAEVIYVSGTISIDNHHPDGLDANGDVNHLCGGPVFPQPCDYAAPVARSVVA